MMRALLSVRFRALFAGMTQQGKKKKKRNTGTIILFAVGFDLVLKEIPWKKTGGLIAMRLVIAGVMLGVLILLNRTVLNGMIFEGAAVLLFILPSPYVIPIFADEPTERVQISSALSALTLITMILFAVCSVVFGLI